MSKLRDVLKKEIVFNKDDKTYFVIIEELTLKKIDRRIFKARALLEVKKKKRILGMKKVSIYLVKDIMQDWVVAVIPDNRIITIGGIK